MVSPSPGDEVTRQGSRVYFYRTAEQGLKAGSQSEGRDMGTGYGPSSDWLPALSPCPSSPIKRTLYFPAFSETA
jgi:hypothetical protein